MTEIQMVTLKSNEQMDNLGDGLIAKALELKATIKDVATIATALYRQGLSDEQVNERLTYATMLQRTSGLKAQDSVKLITVAMANGVTDAARATDVVTALGDSAATNAGEISKGMQKALPAANLNGISYEDLAVLLTIGTSTTQLGGNTMGTMVNTLLGRWNKATKNQITYDENGNRIVANDIQQLYSLDMQLEKENLI